VTGSAYDESRAVVPGVTVTLSNVANGFTRTVTTNSEGVYQMPDVPVGTYQLRARKAGFKSVVVQTLTLEVAQVARVDLSLGVGTVEQSVEVTGTAPLVQSADASVGTLITQEDVTNLPLNGRNFIQLNRLTPGVVAGPRGNFFDTDTTQNDSSFSVNGQRIFFNQFYVDGVNTTQPQANGNDYSPPLDAIQEFKLQQSLYPADMGQGGAGQVNLVTKSGTNDLHGTLWEYLRNDKLDALNYFDLPRAVSKAQFGYEAPPFRQNQFGGVFGGPVVIPKLYDGRNRTFFFVSYEGLRLRQVQTATALIPPLAFRQGDFSSLSKSIIDPQTGAPFPNNQIPPKRISAITQQLLPYYPAPNSADPNRNFVANSHVKNDSNYFGVRLDHKISENDSLFFRYQWQTKDWTPLVLNPNFNVFGNNFAQNPLVGYTHVFNSNLLNELRLSYNDDSFGTITGHSYGPNITTQLGIPGLNQTVARDFGVPQISLSGYQGLGDPATYTVPAKTFQIKDTMSWTHGTHALRFGTDIQRRYYNFLEILNGNGAFSFTGQFTGNAVADFLLGHPATATRSITQFSPRYRQQWLHFFVQDDWRTTSRLTLNLGFRYEANFRPVSANNTIATFDPSTGMMVTPGQAGYPRSLKEGGLHGFGPRVGFAYQLTGDGKTVVRGGYGIYYQAPDTNEDVDLAINPPFIVQDSVTSSITTPTINFNDPFGVTSSIKTSPVLVFGAPKSYPDPYIQQWSVDIQRSLPSNILIDIGYLGNKGTRLPILNWINQPLPGPGLVQLRRPYANFGRIYWIDPVGNSTYHGLQLKSEKRFSRGLSFLVSYAFSKAIDTSSTAVIGTGEGQTSVQDAYNLRAEKGLSLFDTRNVFSASWVWELPVGRGRALNLSGPANAVLGGWQIQGIVSTHSGQPLGLSAGVDRANVGDGTERPNELHNPNLSKSQQTINRFFDTSAFAMPALYTFGNAPRNDVIGPGYQDWDLALEKVFYFSERYSLHFRAESFNLFNHPNFFKPVSTFTASNFGALTAANFSRQIQFALRFAF
jgi:hypothetical protein